MFTHIEGDVYLGSAADAGDETQLSEYNIDYVVTLAEPSLDATTTYNPLTDGKNAHAEFESAVTSVVRHIRQGRTPLAVHCRMGRSRAPTVLATALADIHGESISEGLSRIHSSGRFIAPHPKLLAHAEQYLSESE